MGGWTRVWTRVWAGRPPRACSRWSCSKRAWRKGNSRDHPSDRVAPSAKTERACAKTPPARAGGCPHPSFSICGRLTISTLAVFLSPSQSADLDKFCVDRVGGARHRTAHGSPARAAKVRDSNTRVVAGNNDEARGRNVTMRDTISGTTVPNVKTATLLGPDPATSAPRRVARKVGPPSHSTRFENEAGLTALRPVFVGLKRSPVLDEPCRRS